MGLIGCSIQSRERKRNFPIPITILFFSLWVGLNAYGQSEWVGGDGFRYLDFETSPDSAVGFRLMSPERTGVVFQNQVPESVHLTNQVILNGAGVAAGDIDNDGLCDLYFCGTSGSNALYKNLGDWNFSEMADERGVACVGLTSTGAMFADLNNDGFLDLVVNTLGQGTHLFMNRAGEGFEAHPTILNPGRAGMTVAAADVNRDGYLDLYIANYRTSGLMDIPNARATFKQVNGRTEVATVDGVSTDNPAMRNRFRVAENGRIIEQGEPDAFYLNQKGNGWEAVSFSGGRFLDHTGVPLENPPYEWGLTAMFRDINQDGLSDLYVCNDFDAPDRIWMNQGNGIFKILTPQSVRKGSRFSMAVDFADINRDYHDDFIVVDMMSRDLEERQRFMREKVAADEPVRISESRPHYSYNTLQLNRGDMRFSEIGHYSGLAASDWSWSVSFLDVDLDGDEDVLIGNGVQRAARDLDVIDYLKEQRRQRALTDQEIFELRRMFPKLATPNLAFMNSGGLRFTDRSAEWGFNLEIITTGMALADLDNDGDMDVVLNNFNGNAALLRNESTAPRIQVRLEFHAGNRFGIGAWVQVEPSGLTPMHQEIICGGKYLSSDQAARTFAVGRDSETVQILVRWPNGRESFFNHMPINRIYTLTDLHLLSSGKVDFHRRLKESWFEDQTGLLQDLAHQEDEFDDFSRQPLLPWVQSENGPGLAWLDFNQDGWDDLIVGASRGHSIQWMQNVNGKGFAPRNGTPGFKPLTRDSGGLLSHITGPNQRGLLVSASNYQDGLAVGDGLQLFKHKVDEQVWAPESVLSASEFSFGVLAKSDIDGDGDLDLFVGGRVRAGRYPEPVDSLILKREADGLYRISPTHSAAFKKVGLVQGAVFTDIDRDGDPDLALACHWGSIRLFENQNGEFLDVTEAYGLVAFEGWWNGIEAADLDGDGRMDLIASNLGMNTEYESYAKARISLYYGDWNNDHVLDVLETYQDIQRDGDFPIRSFFEIGQSFSFVSKSIRNNRAFARASVDEILGDHASVFKRVDASWRPSTVFLNRDRGFEIKPLPAEAQLSTGVGLAVADFNGDGKADIVLGQNFFPVEPGRPRQDAGWCLQLEGDGHGNFTVVDQTETGMGLAGQNRSIAVADYDGDNRPDLAVGMNGERVRLLRNKTQADFLSIRLKGPDLNPDGIGSQVKLIKGDWISAVQEVHEGSGFLSRNAPVLFFQSVEAPFQVEVLWPGNRKVIYPVKEPASRLILSVDGNIP